MIAIVCLLFNKQCVKGTRRVERVVVEGEQESERLFVENKQERVGHFGEVWGLVR